VIAEAVEFSARNDLFQPIVLGLIVGSVYGLVGLGLVLLYKSNRIFNFAQGEFGTVAAYVAFWAMNGKGFLPEFPYWVAIAFGLVAGVAAAVATERLVIKPLFARPKVTVVVATAGVALFFIYGTLLIQGPNPGVFPSKLQRPFFSMFGEGLFGRISDQSGLKITKLQVVTFVVLIVLALLAALFFRYTAYGTAILAVSQEPTAASVVGINVSSVSLLTWTIAGFLGAIAGLLVAPTQTITPGFMTFTVLIPGFTAAVVGGITSLPGAFVGGLLIGVVQQLASRLPTIFSGSFLANTPGVAQMTVALVLLAILLVRPAGLLGKEA
jgi:branched-chain amino acid transport system permease protein